ncbi:unnamed protein product, partial [Porites evermanni]
VRISRDAEVKITSTSCNCEAGAGLCNHARGLVYLLEHYRKLGLRSVPPVMSKTSLPQTWHVPQRTAGINPRDVQEVLVQQVKPPSSDAPSKKKVRRIDGQRQNTTNDPKIHMNIDGPENPPAFDVPSLENHYLFVPKLAEINFIEGLSVSLEQSCLYEEETREQSDTQKWHDLRAQRLSSSKFKDVCIRRADFESLAVRQLKKTVQTSAMKHGINTEEEAASAYADSGDCN